MPDFSAMTSVFFVERRKNIATLHGPPLLLLADADNTPPRFLPPPWLATHPTLRLAKIPLMPRCNISSIAV
jgi:hypothetical protein